MNLEKREASEQKETHKQDFGLSHGAKITLTLGVVLSLTLTSLALVLHSLGNFDLKLRLKRRK